MEIIPFGLHNNSGKICWLNSILQCFMSCPSFITAVKRSEIFMKKTGTGTEIYNLISSALNLSEDTRGISYMSKCIYEELNKDIKKNKNQTQFGEDQECVSEGITQILEIIESGCESNPISDLFRVCFNILITNYQEKKIIGEEVEDKNNFIVEIDNLPSKWEDVTENFVDIVCTHCSELTGFSDSTLERWYFVSSCSKIIILSLSKKYSSSGKTMKFPDMFNFHDKKTDKIVKFKLMAQIVHYGSSSHGHYIAQCRRGEHIYSMNDMSVSKISEFSVENGLFLLFYSVIEE